jgi:hypothetical protein
VSRLGPQEGPCTFHLTPYSLLLSLKHEALLDDHAHSFLEPLAPRNTPRPRPRRCLCISTLQPVRYSSSCPTCCLSACNTRSVTHCYPPGSCDAEWDPSSRGRKEGEAGSCSAARSSSAIFRRPGGCAGLDKELAQQASHPRLLLQALVTTQSICEPVSTWATGRGFFLRRVHTERCGSASMEHLERLSISAF